MGVRFRRRVAVKRGCADRFARLMLAYAQLARTYCPEYRLEMQEMAGRRGFFMIEDFPDRHAIGAVRSGSYFDGLWMPVISSLVEAVDIREDMPATS